jgi:pimeloyl-ACP methyl ester carboxylesterase
MERRHLAPTLVLGCVALVLASCGDAQDVAGTPVSSPTRPATRNAAPATPGTGSPRTLPEGFGRGPSGTGLSRFTHQRVDWRPCGVDECARVWVPLDYRRPDGRAITLALRKKPATGTKRGTLFINPGGPGASGVDFVDGIKFGSALRQSYDVLGFDPRGVGASTPVSCLTDRQLDAYIAFDPTPDTPAEIRQSEALWKRFTDGCRRRSGPLLGHVSTVEVAKDMDVLRQLVGDKLLNFYGGSYGTYLGATYAGEFPRHVGRMVLDGAVDPLQSPLKSDLASAHGFEVALDAYLADCVAHGCPLGASVAAAKRRIQSFLNGLDQHPLQVGSRQLTQGWAFYGVVFPLYSRQSWPIETASLTQAMSGSGAIMLSIADQYVGRSTDGSYTDSFVQVLPAVNCLDSPEQETVAQIEAGMPRFRRLSPTFGPYVAWAPYGCSNWPVRAEFPKPDFHAPGAAPIVVVGTTRDPATPYQQAVALARELDSGVLLSRNGDGHTAYISGNSCIDTTVDAYLANGTVPANGKQC